MAEPKPVVHQVWWYGDVWECRCGYQTSSDMAANKHSADPNSRLSDTAPTDLTEVQIEEVGHA